MIILAPTTSSGKSKTKVAMTTATTTTTTTTAAAKQLIEQQQQQPQQPNDLDLDIDLDLDDNHHHHHLDAPAQKNPSAMQQKAQDAAVGASGDDGADDDDEEEEEEEDDDDDSSSTSRLIVDTHHQPHHNSRHKVLRGLTYTILRHTATTSPQTGGTTVRHNEPEEDMLHGALARRGAVRVDPSSNASAVHLVALERSMLLNPPATVPLLALRTSGVTRFVSTDYLKRCCSLNKLLPLTRYESHQDKHAAATAELLPMGSPGILVVDDTVLGRMSDIMTMLEREAARQYKWKVCVLDSVLQNWKARGSPTQPQLAQVEAMLANHVLVTKVDHVDGSSGSGSKHLSSLAPSARLAVRLAYEWVAYHRFIVVVSERKPVRDDATRYQIPSCTLSEFRNDMIPTLHKTRTACTTHSLWKLNGQLNSNNAASFMASH
jgi:hypothetical protein